MKQLTQRTHLSDRVQLLIDTNHGTFRGWVRSTLAECEFALGQLMAHTRPDAKQVHRLVFVCLGNINRSAFAEQVARTLGANTCSLGLSTTTGAPAFYKAVAIAPAFGVDLVGHTATDLSDYAFDAADLLLVMEVRHARALVRTGIPPASIALLGHWATPHRIHLHDPHLLSDAYFHTCFTLIESAVRGLVAHMRASHSPCLAQCVAP